MRIYTTKEELIESIKFSYDKYIGEFEDIPEELKNVRCSEVDKTPMENIAYQVGWTSLLLQWERDEKNGLEVKTPSNLFKWNELGELYKWFYEVYGGMSLEKLKNRLENNVLDICDMINSMSEDELFKIHQRKWADNSTKSVKWSVCKFIHINTVAPFTNFCMKIRKWKKLVMVEK